MATFADITRNRNIHDIWSVVRRFTRGRWAEATIPTMPEIIAMLSLTELTEVTIQPGAQSPYLLRTLDKAVKHGVLVYPKGPADFVLLQNPAINPRIAYNEETGELTFAFDTLPGTLTLIINDMLANDEATTQATLLNSQLQIQGYSPETAYTQGDIALYDDGVRKTLIISNAPTQGEFDPTKWSILVTKDEYQPALALITQNLQNEVTRATAAEQVLRQDIASEVMRATTQENQIAQDLLTEINRATAAEQALSQSLQQEITQRQAKDIASVQYNASTNSLQHTRTDATIVNVALPVADSNKNGLMSKQTYDQVQDLASIVSELVGKGTRRLTSAAINPEPEPTPDATWQESMNALWATASGEATPVDGDTLISTNSATLWRLATYVASSNVWVYRGADTLSIASPTQLGIVLSTQAVDNTMENGGSVFVEQGTGAMVVNGWDNMTGRITSMEAFMNRQSGFATAAQGALADTLDQTAVKITGNQDINGIKNFVGTLQIEGVSISQLFNEKADLSNRNQDILAGTYAGATFDLRHVLYGSICRLENYTRFDEQGSTVIGALTSLDLFDEFQILDRSNLGSQVILHIDLSTDVVDFENRPTVQNVPVLTQSDFVVGEIKIYAGSTAPEGYLMCKGQQVSRTTYAALFSVIGTTYGDGDGSTTFNLPNLAGRVAVGAGMVAGGGSPITYDLGKTGGYKDAVAISHSHTFTGRNVQARVGGFRTENGQNLVCESPFSADNSLLPSDSNFWDNQDNDWTVKGFKFNYTPSGTISYNGYQGIDRNMQPYIVLNYIIKY